MKKIILILMLGFLFGQSDLGRVDGQLKYQNDMIDVIDGTLNALVTVSHISQSIDDGTHFFFETFVDLGSTDSTIVSFTIPDTTSRVRMLWTINSLLAGETYLYEGADVDSLSGGSLVADFNNDRNATDTSMVSIMSGISAVSGGNTDGWGNMGTLISKAKWGTNKVGGSTEISDELIMKNNTIYVRIFKSNAASNTFWIKPSWSEEIPN